MTVQSQKETVETTKTSVTQNSYLKFGKADNTFPYRLVGSYEYGTSLKNLGDLVDSSTSDQIDVYDKLIQSRPEYSFHSGVVMESGLNAKLDSSTSLTGGAPASEYLKHSLAWMMALARVELGATMSMYGESDDPFGDAVAIGGSKFGSDEYLKILMDDLAAHLETAKIDPDYQRGLSLKEQVDATSLADLRRTKLMSDLLDKVISSGESEVISAAGPYAKLAQKAINQLTQKIALATTSFTTTSVAPTTTSTAENDYFLGVRFDNRRNLRRCQKLMEGRYGPPAMNLSPLQ